jgi:hypothetical protein
MPVMYPSEVHKTVYSTCQQSALLMLQDQLRDQSPKAPRSTPEQLARLEGCRRKLLDRLQVRQLCCRAVPELSPRQGFSNETMGA